LRNYEGSIGEFKIAEFKGKELEQAQKRWAGQPWLQPFNKLEAIAAAFITGIADEDVGFEIIGLVNGRMAVAERLDCGVFSAALPRFASRRPKSGDESPQSRRFAQFVGACGFVETRS
jgi:hypothetical protein